MLEEGRHEGDASLSVTLVLPRRAEELEAGATTVMTWAVVVATGTVPPPPVSSNLTLDAAVELVAVVTAIGAVDPLADVLAEPVFGCIRSVGKSRPRAMFLLSVTLDPGLDAKWRSNGAMVAGAEYRFVSHTVALEA